MKVLVSASSKYGATSEIAKAVGEVLAAKGLEVCVVPPEQAGAIQEFDAVILGSAVYMGVAEPKGSDNTDVVQLDRSEYTEVR
jgi:menaquinone-dependent protoporphyrinogen oxidase